jgi:glycosyltransferase involved in cell wall biosynthesis
MIIPEADKESMIDSRSSYSNRVSIVIPCFNCKPYIVECISSVFAQTLAPYQVIAVDDGSTDGTWEILHQLKAGSYPLLQILSHLQRGNKGPSVTRQLGVRAATGDFVAFLDGDDIYYPDKLSAQVKAFHANPDVTLCHTAILVIGDRSRAESFEGYFRHNPKSAYVLPRQKEYLINNYINTSSVMVRVSAIRNVDFAIPYRPYQYEDWLCWCLLGDSGKFLYLDNALTGYRVHPSNTTSVIDSSRLVKLYALLEFRLALLAKRNFRLGPDSLKILSMIFKDLWEIIRLYRVKGD